jgi:hypothetical protein
MMWRRALASYMQSDTVNVAVVDFSSRAQKLDVDQDGPSVGSFVVAERVGHVSILRPGRRLDGHGAVKPKRFLQQHQVD